MSFQQRILIDGIPRTGTTNLAHIVGIRPELRLIIEPFHPRRYYGHHHRALLAAEPPELALKDIWKRFNLIKHVWEPRDGFPFGRRIHLNENIWRSATHLISVERRNLLRRYLSAELSRRITFWIGTREQFVAKLDSHSFGPLDIAAAEREIRADFEALQARRAFLTAEGIASYPVVYEDVFGDAPDSKASINLLTEMNQIYSFLQMPEVSDDYFRQEASHWSDASVYKWASIELYRRFPNIDTFERALGCAEFGHAL